MSTSVKRFGDGIVAITRDRREL